MFEKNSRVLPVCRGFSLSAYSGERRSPPFAGYLFISYHVFYETNGYGPTKGGYGFSEVPGKRIFSYCRGYPLSAANKWLRAYTGITQRRSDPTLVQGVEVANLPSAGLNGERPSCQGSRNRPTWIFRRHFRLQGRCPSLGAPLRWCPQAFAYSRKGLLRLPIRVWRLLLLTLLQLGLLAYCSLAVAGLLSLPRTS